MRMSLTVPGDARKTSAHRGDRAGELPRPLALAVLALAALVQNRPEDVRRFGEEAVDVARRLGDPYTLGEALAHVGMDIALTSDDPRGIEFADESLGIARTLANEYLHSLALESAGIARYRIDPAGAVELLQQSLVVGDRNRNLQSQARFIKAVAHVTLRQHGAAARDLCVLLPIMQEGGEVYFQSMALALTAAILMRSKPDVAVRILALLDRLREEEKFVGTPRDLEMQRAAPAARRGTARTARVHRGLVGRTQRDARRHVGDRARRTRHGGGGRIASGAMDFNEQYGPWALIAGASEGLGAAFADECASRGCNVVLVARREALMEETAAGIRERHGVETRTLVADLGRPDIGELIASVTDDIEVGFFVYNAAFAPQGLFVERAARRPDEEHRGQLHHAHDPQPHARQEDGGARPGGLALVSSGAAHGGMKIFTTYAAAKAYELILGEGLWDEFRDHGVDALGYVVGATATPTFSASTEADAVKATNARTPQQVAAALFEQLGKGPRGYSHPGADEQAMASAGRPRAEVVAATGEMISSVWS